MQKQTRELRKLRNPWINRNCSESDTFTIRFTNIRGSKSPHRSSSSGVAEMNLEQFSSNISGLFQGHSLTSKPTIIRHRLRSRVPFATRVYRHLESSLPRIYQGQRFIGIFLNRPVFNARLLNFIGVFTLHGQPIPAVGIYRRCFVYFLRISHAAVDAPRFAVRRYLFRMRHRVASYSLSSSVYVRPYF